MQNTIENKLKQMGLVLPEPLKTPTGAVLPFKWVQVAGNRAYIAGHLPTNQNGSLAEPIGKVGKDVTPEQAYQSAKMVGLAILGSLNRELGSLDRIVKWLRVFGMVNSAPGFNQQPKVINGFSDFIIELFGTEIGLHARSAVGMAELPFNVPVEIEAEIEISDK